MKFGTSFAYWTTEWTGDYMYYAKKVHDLGFDILEVGAANLLQMSDQEIDDLKALAKDLGLEICSNIGPPKQYDVASKDPAVRAAGIDFLTRIMGKMDRLDSRYLIGVTYTYWPNDFTDLDKPAIWARGVESVKTMGKTAQELGITLCLEVVNRFETLVLNTAAEAVQFCDEVDNPNVKILLDTFHMNIEEDNLADAIRATGDKLQYMHLGEGNRKPPGQGHLPWAEIGQALRDIGFNGRLVMEPFVLQGGPVGKDIKVFRDLSGGATEAEMDAAVKESLAFLKANFLR
ncbi:MAG: sugar phosphate isomerase/epimerase [Oscillospiraceae bacterium]|nr:sugar phosphate isomerase/epimerase [Oscillospiraceae bacterium]